MANFFSSPWFLDAAARIFFPPDQTRRGTVELEGQRYDVLLHLDGSMADIPLFDFLEPRAPELGPPAEVLPTRYLPAVVRGLVPVTEGGVDPGGLLPAPRVDFSRFAKFEEFTKMCAKRSRNAFRRHTNKLERLSAEVGPARFELDVPDHRLLEDLLFWKSRQLRRTRRPDRFSSLRNRQFLHHLLDLGQLKLSVLFAGEQAIAMELGHDDGVSYASWISGYHVAFSRYSPGVLLFERLMMESWNLGRKSFEFLAGGEPYKYFYATHAWLVGPLGEPPTLQRFRSRARAWITDHESPSSARVAAFQAARWVLNQRLVREGLVRDDLETAWSGMIRENQANWPRGRLLRPTECQLQHMLTWGEQHAPPVTPHLQRANVSARRLGRRVWTRAKLISNPPAPAPAAPETRKGDDLSVGDTVRVRSPDEIRATLVDWQTNGIYYIPMVMDPLCGRTFRVERVVDCFYDEVTRNVLRPRDAVLLQGARCDGSQLPHPQECDRRCPVFWSQRWLERVEAAADPGPPTGRRGARSPFQEGDLVRVRPVHQILAAGDGDGVTFVAPLMEAFSGRVFRVSGRLRNVFAEERRAVFPTDGVVHLDGAQCPGAELFGSGRCARGCTLFWREAWLEGVEG